MEGMDCLIANLMLCSEKKCHKLHPIHYKFSPKDKWWLDRCHAFRQLLRLQTGRKVRNDCTVERFAWGCGMDNLIQHSAKDLATLYNNAKWAQKANYRIPLDAKIILLVPTPRSDGEWKSGRGSKAQGYPKKQGTEESVGIHPPGTPTDKEPTPNKCWSPTEWWHNKRMRYKVTSQGSDKRRNGHKIQQNRQRPSMTRSPVWTSTEVTISILEGTFIPPPGTITATRIILEEIAKIWERMGMGEVII